MIESSIDWICLHANIAHYILFFFLILAGLNIPLSEDIILISGGMIASTCIPEHAVRMWVWLYLGCILSAWEAYWIGRLLGPKLYNISWFHRIITPNRVANLHYYYEKYGILTFLVGRFCPGGVRNGLFMTSGLGKMPFHILVFRDSLACVVSSLVLFSIGYLFGQHWETLIYYVKTFDLIFVSLILTIIGVIIFLLWRQKKNRNDSENFP